MQHSTLHSIALLLLCLAWANKAYGQDCLCRVRLDVDPVASTLRLSSLTRLNTISSAIEWQGNVTRGYQGILFACSPQACPTTGSRSAWQSVQFTVSTAANQSLQVYPELNLGRTILGRSLRTWVSVHVDHLKSNLEVEPSPSCSCAQCNDLLFLRVY